MKGLIRKDIYLAAKCSKIYLIIGVVFLVVGALQESNGFIMAYPFMLWSMIPVTLLSYDEHDRWNSYCCALPYTRAQLVSAKYIMGALGTMTIWVLAVLSQGIRHMILKDMVIGPFAEQMALLLTAGFVPAALCLPFIFKLGSEKGRLAYMVTVGLFCGLTIGAGQIRAAGGFSISPIIPILISAVAYAISWRISICVYEKREL